MNIAALLDLMRPRHQRMSRGEYTERCEASRRRDVSKLQATEYYQEMVDATGPTSTVNTYNIVRSRMYGTSTLSYPAGHHRPEGFSQREKTQVLRHRLPKFYDPSLSISLDSSVFSAQFSTDGTRLAVAQQSGEISVLDPTNWHVVKFIQARDIGWAILDTAYSPDMNWIIYSSWSPYVHICNIEENGRSIHQALDFAGQSGRIAFFSIKFSQDSREIIAGSNDCHLYLYDIHANERTLRLPGHRSDINAVCFADESSNVFFSGSDDHLVRVWDRRSLGSSQRSAGTLLGHGGGITFIDSKGDGRYLLSNGKDQTVRLWDIRKMAGTISLHDQVDVDNPGDYRYFHSAAYHTSFQKLDDDCSLMTYRGHSVVQTLIRARFSPVHTTGQRYIYTGGGDGRSVIFDVLTGEIMCKNSVRGTTMSAPTYRDVSWHPYQPMLAAASFGGTIDMFTAPSATSQSEVFVHEETDDEEMEYYGPQHYSSDSEDDESSVYS